MEPAGSRDWACRYELRCRRNCGRALSMGESGLGRTVEARYTTARSTTRASASRPVLLPAATRGPARAWVACASNGGRCSLLLLKTSLARNRGIDGSLRSCGAVQPSRSTDGHVDDPAHHDAGDDLRAGTDRPSAAAETAETAEMGWTGGSWLAQCPRRAKRCDTHARSAVWVSGLWPRPAPASPCI